MFLKLMQKLAKNTNDHRIILVHVYGINSKNCQGSENIFVLKNKISRLYKCYNEKYV